MDVHQTRQRIGTARVNDILALLRGRAKDDAAIADDEVLFHKAAAVAVDFCILIIIAVFLRKSDLAQGFLVADQNEVGVHLQDAGGDLRRDGAEERLLTMSALPLPLATIRTLRACMIVLMPMV